MALDSQDRVLEAFEAYLRCTATVLRQLEQVRELRTQPSFPGDAAKLLGLAQNCLARAQDIVPQLPLSPLPSTPAAPASPNPTVGPSQPGHAAQGQQPANPAGAWTVAIMPSSSLEIVTDPVIVAQQKNAMLLRQYQLKSQTAQARSSQSPSAKRSAEMNVAMMRRCVENVEIAKAKQQRLIEQFRSREARPQEEPRSPVGTWFAEVQDAAQREGHRLADSEWIHRMQANPNDMELVMTQIRTVLATPTRPAAKELAQFASKFNDSISAQSLPFFLATGHAPNPVDEAAFTAVKTEILNFSSALTRSFEILYKPLLDSARAKACVRSVVDSALFPLLYPTMFLAYKYHKNAADARFLMKSRALSKLSIQKFGVPVKFALGGDACVLSDTLTSYGAAIGHLAELHARPTPTQKLALLNEVGQEIVEAVTTYHTTHSTGLSPDRLLIGADDLVPLFSFVLVHAQLPFAASESCLLADFITESAVLGEEGYALATFQTAMDFALSLGD
eukprot:TRINITY_DN12450_c0_g1_i1.p1 TRINITY_DN12450_c0_g1~~TRINITY_DN12450_c0_g1_i1.p1  ORF type:complete len:505 (+),score=99.60 TRINITY_DN12450_c0_g1_i1:896-2410(+)